MDGVYATLCLSKVNPKEEMPPVYTDCRIGQNEGRISTVRTTRDPHRGKCEVPKPSVRSPKSFVRFVCPKK